MSLLDELPEEAASVRAEVGNWELTHELLAQLIEEVSVLAADQRRKEPRSIPRPSAPNESSQKPAANTGLHSTGDGGMKAVGLDGMLGLARMAGAVKSDG